jgi:RimJ/RimL family protein N-acetyltransferase
MLETPRLLLREWRESDIEPFVAMFTDPRVMEFSAFAFSRERAEALVRHVSALLTRDGYGWWVLEVKDSGAFAGTIILQEVPFESHFTPAIEVGWWLAPEHWGNGYATESARAAIELAFKTLGRDEVVAITAPANVRSQAVMKRLGMTCDPAEAFELPMVEEHHPLRTHVLYRLRR